jgi:hypothetical protein
MARMIRIKLNHNIMWIVISVLFACIGLLFAITYGGNKMPSSYNINGSKILKPEVYESKSDTILSLFPVPQDNSIGTNDLSNAITLLSFHNGKVKYDKYFNNVVDDVEGGGEYMPIIAPDTIGFGQSRRFLLYNFRTKDCREYDIVVSLEKTIEKIAIADAGRRHFIFEIEEGNPRSEDPWDVTYNLLLMDLSGKEARLIKEVNIGKGVTWSVAYGRIFLYYIGKDQMRVLTTSFESTHHPLADIIKQNKGKINYTRIYPHQYLPFAILAAGEDDELLISWDKERDQTPKIVFREGLVGSDFMFSPDGKWVVFTDDGNLDNKKTYLMPVSEKYPNYLGTPILLLENYFNPNNCGWTTNPISFVGASSGKLYRWELTKEAHPWIDKPTLHDYVVDYDLEKMKKEKQQGAGEKHK